MSAIRFAVDRIEVTLVGVPPADAESTVRSLEAALTDRLGGWQPDIAGAVPMDLGDINLGTVDLSARLNAATLATLLFERFADQVEDAVAQPRSAV
jgi:hypothetical protein